MKRFTSTRFLLVSQQSDLTVSCCLRAALYVLMLVLFFTAAAGKAGNGPVSYFALSAPWKNADIGAVGVVGSASYSSGIYTVKGAGYDFWYAPDNFHYVYQPISGNTTVIAKVTSIQNTSPNAKAGIMIRESLSPNASFVATVVNPTGTLFMTRTGTGKPSYAGRSGSGSAPKWLRLVRSGNTFTSSYSTDGTSWITLSTVSVTMPAIIYVGLCVTSNNTTLLNTSSFTNVSVTGQVPTSPSVISVIPANGATGVSTLTSISTSVLNLPNGGIDNATITTSTVMLKEAATSTLVPSTVNGTGGRDGITLVPNAPLKPITQYRFEITSGVKDLAGISFKPYSSTFTTESKTTEPVSTVKFKKVALLSTTDRYTSLAIGPDYKLYALTVDGRIKRYAILSDGKLGSPQEILSLQTFAGGKRLCTGFVFDPSATASNLICYITHHNFVFESGPDWDGKLARLSGPSLEKVENLLINLPRSVKDHLSQSLAFGPDGALYFPVGSNSAMGRADATWGNRQENLLSAAILRLSLSLLSNYTLPLNVKTAEGGGSYNPYSSLSPLTIYASGLRNAYDLFWHSNGELYAPTNGSNPGGNTPASVAGTRRMDGSLYSGPSVPALTSVSQTMFDYLFRVQKGGYYGHPNPRRGEYVLNGGNPTSGVDPAEVTMYPVGTLPDANYRGYAYDFSNNKSPNGVIEYKSNTFNGALKGKLLVVRFSQKNDIIVLEAGTTKNIVKATEGIQIAGFSGFLDPLDLVEDTRNGNIYVSEYDQLGSTPKLTLLVPDLSTTTATARSGYSAEDLLANPEFYDEAGLLSFHSAWSVEGALDEQLSIVPNPASDRVLIGFRATTAASVASLKVYNMLGQLVAEQSFMPVRSYQLQTLLDTSRLPKGRYLLVVTEGNKRYTGPLIKW